ncbi:hypothetical protein [Leuconostoc falkenbergense]|uniref:hypothetical protein n=1 Tax=Leuconostoc falkenbergense TaxID=2766470 RepID=UPI0028B24372|nr:hypothetical protein [Leuconostoc falkenbergense]
MREIKFRAWRSGVNQRYKTKDWISMHKALDMVLESMEKTNELNSTIEFEAEHYSATISVVVRPRIDRISPDDIGNDIHEFLHGGDK